MLSQKEMSFHSRSVNCGTNLNYGSCMLHHGLPKPVNLEKKVPLSENSVTLSVDGETVHPNHGLMTLIL